MVKFKNEYLKRQLKVRGLGWVGRNHAEFSPDRGQEGEARALLSGEHWFPSLSVEETVELRDFLNDVLKDYHLDRQDVEAQVSWQLEEMGDGSVVQFVKDGVKWFKSRGKWISEIGESASSADFEHYDSVYRRY